MTKITHLDFTGNTIFCGLDVHKLSWRVNIRDKDAVMDSCFLESKAFTPISLLLPVSGGNLPPSKIAPHCAKKLSSCMM